MLQNDFVCPGWSVVSAGAVSLTDHLTYFFLEDTFETAASKQPFW
jgi:hypothetical protein